LNKRSLAKGLKQVNADSSEDEQVIAKQELVSDIMSSSSSDSEPEAKPAAKIVAAQKKPAKKEAEGGDSDDEIGAAKWAAGDRKPTIHPFKLLDQEVGYLGPRGIDLDTPLDNFRMFLTSELSATIVTNTNDYGQNSEKAWDRWVDIDSYDLDQYIGICIYMGICVLPSIEDYWSASFGCKSRLQHVMTMDRFEMIVAHLHVAPQNVDDKVDKLAKVREFLNQLNDRCTCLWACGRHLSYDEMMVKCKSKFCRARMRMPDKPIKDGLKIFGLCCSDTGYIWRHHVYSGEPCENWQTLGKTGAAISLVCRPFVNQGRTIYMDNYFTSVKIIRHLHSLGFNVVGTARSNRVDKSIVMKKGKQPAGTIKSLTTTDDPPVCSYAVQDRGVVYFLSSMHKESQRTTVTRQSGAKVVEVTAPLAMKEYNEGMGGCDTADQKRASYRVQRKRIARWYMSLVYWAVDVMVINSYVIFCSQAIEIISHKKYRLVLAEALMQSGKPPAVAEAKVEPCPKRLKPNEPKPEQRLQGGLHAPVLLEKGLCCVQCKGPTRVRYGCDTCKRAMHIECFRAWHTE
jgi:Transposase IS4